MESKDSQNPLHLPKIRKLTSEEKKFVAEDLNRRGGEAVNPANPESPTFMVKDQENPGKLPHQKPSGKTHNN